MNITAAHAGGRSSIRRLPNPNAGVAAHDGSRAYDTDVFGTRWQVDRLVYDLYGLTAEEIGIVEGK
jgi:hypothetical protein